MKYPLDRADRLAALRIVAVYVLFAATWIYFSENIMGLFVQDPAILVRIGVLKGFCFIIVTGVLLYQLIFRYIRRSRQTEEALGASRNLIAAIIEGTTDAIYVKDRQGRYLQFNNAAAHITGKAAPEVIGHDDTILFSAEEAKAVMAGDLQVMASGRVMTYEEYLTAADGSSRTFLSTKGPVFTATGEVSGLFGIARDITGRKQAERELQEKNAELERFTYMISHDLKSPLITVRTFLGYLEQDLANIVNYQVEKDISFIRTAADKMGQMLDELSEMSRIGRMVNPSLHVTFRELAEESLKLVAGSIAERKVEVLVDDSSVSLYGDRLRLVEIWQNLVENAIKFMGEQPSPCIEIGAAQSGGETVFFVRDNGMGIDERYNEKIFGLFEKLDRMSPGTGLGLALVKRIVELYRGTIWLELPGPEHGACFRFTLPEAVKDSEKGETS